MSNNFEVMREIKIEIDEKTAIKQIKKISQSLKKLTCDICNREDGAKSEWEGTIKCGIGATHTTTGQSVTSVKKT